MGSRTQPWAAPGRSAGSPAPRHSRAPGCRPRPRARREAAIRPARGQRHWDRRVSSPGRRSVRQYVRSDRAEAEVARDDRGTVHLDWIGPRKAEIVCVAPVITAFYCRGDGTGGCWSILTVAGLELPTFPAASSPWSARQLVPSAEGLRVHVRDRPGPLSTRNSQRVVARSGCGAERIPRHHRPHRPHPDVVPRHVVHPLRSVDPLAPGEWGVLLDPDQRGACVGDPRLGPERADVVQVSA